MILIKFTLTTNDKFLNTVRDSESKRGKIFDNSGVIAKINKSFQSIYNIDKKNLLTITDCNEGVFTVVLAYEANKMSLAENIDCIKNAIPDATILTEEEITLEEFRRELVKAEDNEWIVRGAEYFLRELKLKLKADSNPLFEDPYYIYSEKVYQANGITKKKTLEKLGDIMASNSFYDEIERIYSSENKKRFVGHPVHYLITAGDKAAADEMIEILIQALLKNKRLLGGRVCNVEKMHSRAYREENFNNLFIAGQGSTLVFNLSADEGTSNYASAYHKLTEYISKKMKEYGNEILFIFVDVSGKRAVSDEAMATILENADMIHLDEGHGDLKMATEYLSRLAGNTEFDDYDVKDLLKHLPEDKADYTVSDIYCAYNRWYGRGLKTHIYRAYKEKDIVKLTVKKKNDKPYEELSKMIGLADVKQVTDEILSAAKMKQIRKSMGLDTTSISLHMLFSGNPGTAKTTVARLLSQILKDEEVLSYGQLVECGRQDLVGKYVGWTAKIVEEKFRAARGGILFIDEAYALVDDSKSFGQEAINAIVQMMENYRDDVIVIFAGYPDKMKEFLEQNEGLRSRIAFHMNFPDYNAKELTQIMKLMLENQGYECDEDSLEKCFNIFEQVTLTKDFGNGRYVRNLLEHAIMHQANRLCKQSDKTVTKQEAISLIAEDFEVVGTRTEKKPMGLVG